MLAAGMGTRLREVTGLGPKTLVNLRGVPLLSIVFGVLRCAGARRVHVVAHPQWARDYYRLAVEVFDDVTLTVNHRWWLENGYSLLLALRSIGESTAVVVMSDHIVHPEAVRRVAAALHGPYAAYVGCDRSPRLVDVEEATKVSTDAAGRVTAIGKGLRSYSCIDIGVLGFRRDDVLRAVGGREDVTVSAIVSALAEKGLATAVDVTGLPWKDVDTADDYFSLARGPASQLLEAVMEIVRGGCVELA